MKIGRYEATSRTLHIGSTRLRLWVPCQAEEMLDDPAVQQRFEQDEYMPYWAECWPAGLMLAETLLARLESRKGQRILEIGGGLGTVGLVLARAEHRIVITDYDADAVAFASASASSNDIHLDGTAVLDWREAPTERFPVIVGADLLYEHRNHQPILAFLQRALDSDGVAYLSDPNRAAAAGFPECARATGFDCASSRLDMRESEGPPVAGRLFTLRRIDRETRSRRAH